MTRYNFHTHSCFDDGKGHPSEYLKEAQNLGLEALGFSAHVPLPMKNKWSLTQENYVAYVSEVKKLKAQNNSKTKVYLGLELDYAPLISQNFKYWIDNTPLDYAIGSVHLITNPENGLTMTIDGSADNFKKGLRECFDENPRKLVETFFGQSIDMVKSQPFEIIGHLDKVKMHLGPELLAQTEDWYLMLVNNLLFAIKEAGIIVELNPRGVYTGKTNEFFPSDYILERCLGLGIPVMVNTDAHHPSQVQSHFEEATKRLKEIGFKKVKTPFFETEI
jgi:histidinol-phosphatase (PHP family)